MQKEHQKWILSEEEQHHTHISITPKKTHVSFVQFLLVHVEERGFDKLVSKELNTPQTILGC